MNRSTLRQYYYQRLTHSIAATISDKTQEAQAEAKAAEATKTSGCPCKLRGWVGQEEGEEITHETKLSYEWCSIRIVTGQPYTVQIKYRDVITQGRSVPNCPMRLAGRPGLVYSVAFFEQFAAKICQGLEFCGLVYEGSSLTLQKSLPAGGIDVLDQPVYWQFPSGTLRCVSARSLQRSPRLGESAG